MNNIIQIVRQTQIPKERTSDGMFAVGENAKEIFYSKDGKIEFVIFSGEKCLAGVVSVASNTAYYPLNDVSLGACISSVVMDLDGTTASSENFWIEIIRLVVTKMMGNENFIFEKCDIPFISGHSVSEHLSYCIRKYVPSYTLDNAMAIYRDITEKKLKSLMDEDGEHIGFEPMRGIKEFLSFARGCNVKTGLVTSGSLDKAHPEIMSILRRLGYKDPSDCYSTIITAGNPLDKNLFGTLGELSAKPHPWLYVEACCIGLGEPKGSQSVVGFEDSGAGVMALRLANIPVIGVRNGNIVDSGFEMFCECMVDDMTEALDLLKGRFVNGR